jgi:hypothetical protein
MNQKDPSKKFCSEVAFWAYQPFDVNLWAIGSRLSSPGTTAWLASLGVEYFETQEPADLEYDPQLKVVAEWRDPETLFKDHVHNAILDALLERADAGEPIGYDRARLPLARMAKAYSAILNSFGVVGPIPKGMSATTALRVQRLKARHAHIEASVMREVDAFRTQQGYVPPYWALLRMARDSAK